MTNEAKPFEAKYVRNHPHINAEGRPIFITFSTFQRWELPDSVRQLVLNHCLHDHGKKYEIHAAVIMPDHVHVILTPLCDSAGQPYGLAQIMNSIKGASAHSINKALNRKGHVWQSESFDRVLRKDEDLHAKGEYICKNPVRKGLVAREEEWPWLWIQWRDHKLPQNPQVGCGQDQSQALPSNLHPQKQPRAAALQSDLHPQKQPRAAALQSDLHPRKQPRAAALHLNSMSELGLPPERLPRHIAIIMDGNGRWAQRRGLPRLRGHEAGADKVQEIVTRCSRLGVGYLTLYSFSTENWNRPETEVGHLMRLYVEYLIKERVEIMENGVRLVQIGRRAGLPDDVLRELDETMRLSKENPGMTLCLALNYSGRMELTDAVRNIARRVAAGELSPGEIEEQTITDALYTAGIPDPDLLIRTAGEMRISNFLLWQISYAELVVTDVCWPDFGSEALDAAIKEYGGRNRRFGNV